jgi:aminopeptidase
VAGAGYRRGARFVDVSYYDPFVKRARIEHADPKTLGFVPPWYGQRMLGLGDADAARVGFSGVVWPYALDGLDPALIGLDQLPWLAETSKIIDDRSTNWCGSPARILNGPSSSTPTSIRRRLRASLGGAWHIYRSRRHDPTVAWDERVAALQASAQALNAGAFDAIELSGPGTQLTLGLLPSSVWQAGDFVTRKGIRHLPNIPTEEVFTAPDPARVDGYVTATRPLVLRDGTIIRGLQVRFEGGRAIEIEAEENAEALLGRAAMDDGAGRLGELALVDREGRIGPLGTVFYDTLFDENAASHIALGNAYAFSAGEEDRGRLNKSGIHIDFMIGSLELEVTGVTRDGTRVPVMQGGSWQL